MNDPLPPSSNQFLSVTGEEKLPAARRYLFDIFRKLSAPHREAMLDWANKHQSRPQAISHVRMFAAALAQRNIDLSQVSDWRPLLDAFMESQKKNLEAMPLLLCRQDIMSFFSSWFDAGKTGQPRSARPTPALPATAPPMLNS